MYEFATGPLVWIAFCVFIFGIIFRIIIMIKGAEKEKSVIPFMNRKFGFRSLVRWLLPFGTKNMQIHPIMTGVSFAFHACVVIVPLFAMGHIALWDHAFGFSLKALPALVTDIMTAVVIFAGGFFFARRIFLPQVRNVTTFGDLVILIVVMAPFVTGLLSHLQLFDYAIMIRIHIITGALWLMVIPFTRLSHMFWFFFTRTYMGSEFGSVRNARDW